MAIGVRAYLCDYGFVDLFGLVAEVRSIDLLTCCIWIESLRLELASIYRRRTGTKKTQSRAGCLARILAIIAPVRFVDVAECAFVGDAC